MTKIKAGRAVPRAKGLAAIDGAVPMPDKHVELDYVALAKRLVGAKQDFDNAKGAAIAAHEAAIEKANASLLDRIASVARECPGFTMAQWDAHLKAPVTDAFKAAGYAMAGPDVSRMGIAFVALANGIAPKPEYAANLAKFANEQAREELEERGLKEPSAKGRKKGTTSDKVKSARLQAAMILSGGVDVSPDVAKARATMLELATRPGNWKLLEKALKEAARHFIQD